MLTKSQIKCDTDTICGDANYSQLQCSECSKRCFLRGLANQASLAIDLAAEVDRLKAERRWITDRKPDSGVTVLLLCEVRPECRKYVCDGYYATPKTIVSGGNLDETNGEYDEETDEYYLCEGWYEVVKNWQEYSSITIEDFVIGWMPLPEPEGSEK